ncbi:alpha/beta hydrolase [Clostridium estertheticum]|uniref:alpha/beta fold hydrolase n=1 Tax=Clostridium estertheticum TaxID=238834 RepID=UPI001C0CF67B|nr:alpha/beta hydrolase [Clostridium estertheticum]MBU3176811.1 alpha/beta hydrolase [Clostridium estertheticum]
MIKTDKINILVKDGVKMQFYEFGKEGNLTVLLIHGTASSWQGEFAEVIDGLAGEYRIICVGFDGHDKNDHNTFRHINDQILGIEKYIKERYNGHLYGVYGSSLGGSVLGKLLERKNVQIDIAITGSTDFEQNTKIYCTYGTKEDTKTLTRRYIQHFPKAELVALGGMHHEEFLVFNPDEWIDMMKHLLKREAYSYPNG